MCKDLCLIATYLFFRAVCSMATKNANTSQVQPDDAITIQVYMHTVHMCFMSLPNIQVLDLVRVSSIGHFTEM